MANRRRNVLLKFFVTTEEQAFIHQKMNFMKTKNLSAYLRKMAMDGYILNVDYSQFKEICAALQGIGNNINQIAKRINATDNPYREDINEIKKKQEEVWRLLKFTLSKLP